MVPFIACEALYHLLGKFVLTVKAMPKYSIIETHCLAFPRKKGADMIEAVPLSSQWQPKNMQGFFCCPFQNDMVDVQQFSVLQNAGPSRTHCWYIGTFKNPAVKETCIMPMIQAFK